MERPLKHFTDEQLQLEIAERLKEKNKKPEPVTNPDWSRLISYLQEGVTSVSEEKYAPKDFEHYCFEIALETVYGKDIWKWWNSHF